MHRLLQIIMLVAVCSLTLRAADAQAPTAAEAGAQVTLPVSDNGTIYVFGPGTAIKKDVKTDEPFTFTPRSAGRYTAILNGSTTTVQVVPAASAEIAFIARPSRVPASRPDAISGTVFIFDANRNLVLKPTPVNFNLSVDGGSSQSHQLIAKNGVANIKLDSGRKAGAAQFIASVGDHSVRRVVQQTAADPCNLRMHAKKTNKGVLVETDPIRDCAGNPVPDGTIVTFSALGEKGRSTIDARIKKGVARAELPPMQNATLSVAAGVVVGNEIRWGGGM